MTISVFRRRLPFLGIFLSASAGILASSQFALGSLPFLCASACVLAVWMFQRREAWLFPALALAFAVAHAIQTRESPAVRLAAWTGEAPHIATVRGTVAGIPTSTRSGGCRFEAHVSEIEVDGTSSREPFRLMVLFAGPAPTPGDTIEASGSLVPVAAPRNPGEFDARRYFALRGIHSELRVRHAGDLKILSEGSPYSLQRIADACRKWMERTLREGISDQPLACGLLAGIVLGDTSGLPDSLEEQFRNTGTFHLFSVSGLHVGMIALILWQFAKTVGLGRRAAVGLIIPSLFFYALITGWKPASIRAATMAGIVLIGMLSSRQPVVLNSLCAAGTGILVLSTNELFNPGFQFSFSVVLAIILVAGPLQSVLRRRWEPDAFLPVELWGRLDRLQHAVAGKAAGLAAVSVAAWFGSIPLTAWYFHMVPLSALLANPLAVPLAFAVMVTALLALGGGLASAWIASVFNNANLVFTQALLAVVQFTAALPGATVHLASPSSEARVTVFDFGRGGCSAIECAGKLWLLDAGSAWNARSALVPWMRLRGRTMPDGIVLSHGDASHLGGVEVLLAESGAPMVVDAMTTDGSPTRKAVQRFLDSRGIPVSLRGAGDTVEVAPGFSLEVLHPPTPAPAGISDDKVLVVRLDTPDLRVLFLSDAGPSVWQRLPGGAEIQADVLVLGRHRSGELPEATQLKSISPRAVVVTGAGFPGEEKIEDSWVGMVQGLGIEVLRQDQSGAVEIAAGADGVEIREFLNDGFR